VSDEDRNIFDRLKTRGEEVFEQVSNELMQNEHFVKAMQGALEGKQKIDRAVGKAMKSMNVPTRSDLKRAVARIETLESEVAALKDRLKSAGKGKPKAKKAAKKR
jgi:polyhydroxyalkanoate synthesis regulator phasin